jgi:hypothetical protein
MSNLRLDRLPKELIAHVASSLDASSLLRLAATCKAIRFASYDSVVIKAILLTSQRHNWQSQDLDVDAIAARATNDAEIWARYAVADQRAYELLNSGHTSESYINYLPELFVAKHPLIGYSNWKESQWAGYKRDPKLCELFCFVLGFMDPNMDPMNLIKKVTFHLRSQKDFRHQILSTLFKIYIAIRASLKMRDRAWPYNNAANVPFIEPPIFSQIPLRPLNESYYLPAPFSRTGLDILGGSTSSFSSWDSWYDLHNLAALQNPSYFTTSKWAGYYMFSENLTTPMDPPMMDVSFRVVSTETEAAGSGHTFIQLRAEDAYDGLDRFDVTVTVSCVDREVRFLGHKKYRNRPEAWRWDCRLTPFGIVGVWGRNDSEGRFHAYGPVWLWKSDWTAEV